MDTVYVLTKWVSPDDGSPGNQTYVRGDTVGLVRTLRSARPFNTVDDAQAYVDSELTTKTWHIIPVDKKVITNPPKN
jgi:hypothetical protein